MRDAFYTDQKRFTIYALVNPVEGPFVYIGKTASHRISAVYFRHRCGNVKATAGYCDLKDEVPELYVLERVQATEAIAYRRVLAWLRCFLDEGYYAINHEGTDFQARNLYPETEEIYQAIRKKPLKTILEQALVARPADANLPPERKPALLQPQEKTVQMNVRINRSDKLRFEKHCRSRGLNQRQGFALLLETGGERRIYREQAQRIDRLQSARDRLRRKVDDLEGHGPKEGSAQAYLALLIPGLKRYFDTIHPLGEPDSPVPRMSLNEFKRKHSDERQYRYPEEEGFYQIQPMAATWGKKKAWFLMCRGEKGEKYRLRTYPREDYVGYSFRGPLPVGLGTPWLVGIRRAKGCVMEIFAALPLNAPMPDETQTEPETPAKASLDSQIQQARSRTQ